MDDHDGSEIHPDDVPDFWKKAPKEPVKANTKPPQKSSNQSRDVTSKPPNRGGGNFHHKGGKKPSQEPVPSFLNQHLDSAVATFQCDKAEANAFNSVDPFNPENKVSGFICKKESDMLGALYITHVNSNELLLPQFIYGAPKIHSPYVQKKAPSKEEQKNDEEPDVDEDSKEFIDFPKAAKYILTNKWNGSNVLFYKYQDNNGETFVSAKPRTFPFVSDTPSGNTLSGTKEVLNLQNARSFKLSEAVSHDSLKLLSKEDVQSICFELCGNKFPHLVKYDFELALKPLFITMSDGRIQPVLEFGANNELGQEISGEDQPKLASILAKYQEESFQANEKYRAEKGLSRAYWYDHFIVEGRVLYIVDKEGFCLNRDSLYKIKPQDIELFHWEQFDSNVQFKVMMALQSLYEKGLEVNDESLRKELDMSVSTWNKWSRDILEVTSGIPNPKSRSKHLPQVLILVGVPGSGKSTVANELTKFGWDRVNQDEMGNRKVCEQRMEQALQKGKSVVVDRCNFDIAQRRHWFKIAHKYGVTNINALCLNIDPEICKKRILVRKDHPTIKEGSAEGAKIIDNFKKLLVWPKPCEGFGEITWVNKEEEANEIVLKYSLEGLTLDSNWKGGKGKGKQ